MTNSPILNNLNLKPLKLGNLTVWPPVVLAPMAGVTHYPFRRICKKFGNCLTVSEMVTARPLVENNARTLHIAEFGPDETPRSIQLYGVDPKYIGLAVKKLVLEGKVDHIDLNFGCPVKKVTRKGGGAALPYKINLLRDIIKQAVNNSEHIPITVKFRMGINHEHLTYLDTGYIAQEEGCSAVALHARTAAQMYSGEANWDAIKLLKQKVKHIPVLGNGDIFTAEDAYNIINHTHCDGVVIGRGCLGRPWLFQDLNNLFNKVNSTINFKPDLRQVVTIMFEHLSYMIDWFGEKNALLKFRKDACYYLKGFRDSAKIKTIIMQTSSFKELYDLLHDLNLDEPYPENIIHLPRGKTGRAQTVALPHGFLNSREDHTPIDSSAELNISGG